MRREVLLSLAAPEDAPRIAALSRDRIEHGLGWRWTAPRVLRSIRDPSSNVVVALAAGAPDPLPGFGIMKYHDDEAHLLLLAVGTGCSRAGIGAAMLQWLERCARVAGLGQVVVESRFNNGVARAFYARQGYQEIQVLPGYYQGREAGVRLAKDLWLTSATPGRTAPGRH